jgi:hypothetical protein
MKTKSVYLAAALATMFLLAGNAVAQSNLQIRVNVPFQFVAEDKTFAAGEYEITQMNETVLVLRNLDDHLSAVEKTGPSPHEESTRGVTAVVFHHVGGQYFLDQVTTRSAQSAYQLLVSSQEKHLAQARPMPTLNVVSVAAHDNGIGGK